VSLPELCIRRPVLATVMSLILVLLGLYVLERLPIRALPDVEATSVSVTTRYIGASPEIVETEITEPIESAISGIAGVDTISSQSSRGQSRTTLDFTPQTAIDEAVNDVRDAISRILDRLPDDADQPIITKNDSDADPIMRISVLSPSMAPEQLTDFTERFLLDRLTTIDGIAQIEFYGERRPAIRVWLDRLAMAARDVTVDDVEQALARNSLELPAGELRAGGREFFVRANARLSSPDQFSRIVIRQDGDFPIRLRDVATVAPGVEEDQSAARTNGKASVNLGVLRQSQANTVAISARVREVLDGLRPVLPADMEVIVTADDAQFINAAILEVGTTLALAVLIVIVVIFLFTGSLRATLVPAVTIPVTLTGTFFGLWLVGYSINILTLLALVLAIGIIVDDAIVVFENIQRRYLAGEDRTTAAIKGSNQVMFVVLATSTTLIAVFVPLTLMEGTVGRLFVEFGVILAIAVIISTFVALSLCAMLTSRVLPEQRAESGWALVVARGFTTLERAYGRILTVILKAPWLALPITVAVAGVAIGAYAALPSELTPPEDRGRILVTLTGPQGASFTYTDAEAVAVERVLDAALPAEETKSITTIAGFRNRPNRGFVIVSLVDWENRDRSSAEIASSLIGPLRRVVGINAFPFIPAGLGLRGSSRPLQVVIGGYDHGDVEAWSEALLQRMEENENLLDVQSDYEQNQPEIDIEIQRLRADDLGISVETIGRTLQTMFASRTVTRYIDRGREYDVIVQAAPEQRQSPQDLRNVFVRSERTGALLPLDAVVAVEDRAAAATLRRYDRLPSITITAALADGYDLGTAVADIRALVAETLPGEARLSFGGLTKEYLESSSGVLLTLLLSIAIIYLVLAAQFESFRQPFAILLTVPLAVTGALLGLWLTGNSLNIYSQVGLILLVGLMAKNGILIVDFANQRVTDGLDARQAALEAAVARLRPIVMTLLSTVFGAVPLVLAFGAGAEARFAIGLVIICGLGFSVLLTLLLSPALYVVFGGAARSETGVRPEGRKAPMS